MEKIVWRGFNAQHAALSMVSPSRHPAESFIGTDWSY